MRESNFAHPSKCIFISLHAGGTGRTGKVNGVKGHGTDNTVSMHVKFTACYLSFSAVFYVCHCFLLFLSCLGEGGGGSTVEPHFVLLYPPVFSTPVSRVSIIRRVPLFQYSLMCQQTTICCVVEKFHGEYFVAK